MNTKNGLLLTAILLALLLGVGCSGTAAETLPTATSIPPTETPIPPHTVAIAEDVGIEVIFDGSECTFSGPSSLPLEDYQFVIKRRNTDTNDLSLVLIFARILDGHTFQDLLDLDNDPQVFNKLTLNGAIEMAPSYRDEENDTIISRISFIKEGEYVAFFRDGAKMERVFCGPETLMVTEAVSE